MDRLVAPVEHLSFEVEALLKNQIGAKDLPFPGMDKSGSAVCDLYVHSVCQRDTLCPFRHVRGDKKVVCKHYLRGLCKKGDQCEFLHEYDMTKMPECYFYSRFNACHNKECPFRHVNPESKIRECPWYDRGFCRHGPSCRHRHVRRVLCINYLAGFCPSGVDCQDAHPKFELPAPEENIKFGKKVVITCHYCGEPGHKVSHCTKMPAEMREKHNEMYPNNSYHGGGTQYGGGHHGGGRGGGGGGGHHGFYGYTPRDPAHAAERREKREFKPLEEIVCFKCGEKGHFANRCTKGHLAFLSSKRLQMNQEEQQQRDMQQQQPVE